MIQAQNFFKKNKTGRTVSKVCAVHWKKWEKRKKEGKKKKKYFKKEIKSKKNKTEKPFSLQDDEKIDTTDKYSITKNNS